MTGTDSKRIRARQLLMPCMDSTGNARSCPFTHGLSVLDMHASISAAVCVPTMQHSQAPNPLPRASLVGFLLRSRSRVFQLTEFASQCHDPAHLSIHTPRNSPDLITSRSVPPIMTALNSELLRIRGGGGSAMGNPSADSCSALPIRGRHRTPK